MDVSATFATCSTETKPKHYTNSCNAAVLVKFVLCAFQSDKSDSEKVLSGVGGANK